MKNLKQIIEKDIKKAKKLYLMKKNIKKKNVIYNQDNNDYSYKYSKSYLKGIKYDFFDPKTSNLVKKYDELKSKIIQYRQKYKKKEEDERNMEYAFEYNYTKIKEITEKLFNKGLPKKNDPFAYNLKYRKDELERINHNIRINQINHALKKVVLHYTPKAKVYTGRTVLNNLYEDLGRNNNKMLKEVYQNVYKNINELRKRGKNNTIKCNQKIENIGIFNDLFEDGKEKMLNNNDVYENNMKENIKEKNNENGCLTEGNISNICSKARRRIRYNSLIDLHLNNNINDNTNKESHVNNKIIQNNDNIRNTEGNSKLDRRDKTLNIRPLTTETSYLNKNKNDIKIKSFMNPSIKSARIRIKKNKKMLYFFDNKRSKPKVINKPLYISKISDFITEYNKIKNDKEKNSIDFKLNHLTTYRQIDDMLDIKEELEMFRLKEKYFKAQSPCKKVKTKKTKKMFINEIEKQISYLDEVI